ncbi:chalcone isomerase family protein [Shewanella gelidii]|uniref:Chalcone isomerase n=1 Tax=Shewanella gelidii TaxID=1642821 RepID=A0A917NDL8_9GAMM|nr:chalcone isomerase family protein [Shewanella gelidii]MCL1098808.1 chalcone isomerase family protein [Shewanella gelidii]GGI87525.1 chalcone isomerase [Shewanella gelidii]
MKKQLLFAAAFMGLSGFAQAGVEVSGVEVPDSITPQETLLKFNGAGVRSKFFVDLYVGSLFTTAKVQDGASVLNSDQPAAIRLNVTSGMITSEKMTNALNEGFEKATGGDTSKIDDSIKAFIAVFDEQIKEGDQFTFLSVPGHGITSFKNGKKLSVTGDDIFRKAVLGIWLGQNPTDEDLKEDMLDS